MSIKNQLHQACVALVQKKVAILEKAILEAQQAASEDTKSSAGDKFETSREMMKLEIQKNNIQLSKASEMMNYLDKIEVGEQKETIAFGSLVTTNEGDYYFSIGLGKVMLNNKPFFALSMASPIGKALQGKKAGEEVEFMGRRIRIEGVE